ncbi:MAG: hypothetical protein IJF12_05035 [Alphaproteobacteria bacterium]|nr:hypothetical protein [Alphaproteobacteria bacterium]
MEFFKNLFAKIKQAIHNKFFREVYCSNCGAKGKVMFFKKLKDESLLCKACVGRIPSELADYVDEGTMDNFKYAIELADRSKKEYEPIFNDDAGFHLFEVDSKHLLFKIYGESDLILPLSCIEYYNFEFKGEEVKEGFLGDKVKGDVYVTLMAQNPPISYCTTVAFGLKAKAEKKFLSNTYVYGTPKELEEFLSKFDMLYDLARKKEELAIQ